MGNISIKINMYQLKHIKKEFTGKEGNKVMCLVIPIEENKMFLGEKGVYLDITAIEIKNKQSDSKDTHLLKQSFSKEFYDSLTQEQKESYPILGNAIQWGRQEANPVQSGVLSDSAVDEYIDVKEDNDNDPLPF